MHMPQPRGMQPSDITFTIDQQPATSSTPFGHGQAELLSRLAEASPTASPSSIQPVSSTQALMQANSTPLTSSAAASYPQAGSGSSRWGMRLCPASCRTWIGRDRFGREATFWCGYELLMWKYLLAALLILGLTVGLPVGIVLGAVKGACACACAHACMGPLSLSCSSW